MFHKNKPVFITVLIIILSFLLSTVGAYGAFQDDPEKFGTVEYFSTFTAGTTLTDSFYFSDEWFLEDPKVCNDALGLVSMQLVAAAVENDENGKGTSYLRKLGFEETGLGGFDEEDPDGCNYTWGIKTIGGTGDEAFTLVAVVIQSHSADQVAKQIGWRQNFLVNGSEITAEHASYAAAAESVLPWIEGLGISGNVKYWIMGQSRGGAIAGILAARLKDAADSVYAYTFESPENVDISAVQDNEQVYGYIHNYLCSDDIVTMIPSWGMGRYGVEHRLNTEETALQLPSVLDKMGQDYDTEYIENYAENLIRELFRRVPSREDYSTLQTDTFTDGSGEEISISYIWQDELIGLMKIVFGNIFEGLDMNRLLEDLPEILPAVSSLYKAVKEDSDSDFYEAAKGLSMFLEKADFQLPLELEDIYVLLKLTGHVIVDEDFVPETDEISQDELTVCISPVFILYDNRNNLIFSHQFDTIIARLKVLATEPALENIDVIAGGPSPGEDTASSSEKVQDAFNAAGCSWMSVSAEWETKDPLFMNDKVYYLTVDIAAVGHSIPEGFTVTIDGKEPVEPPEITYEKGVTNIRGTWKYILSSPELVKVSFDMEGYGADPEPVYAETGSKLRYIPLPDVPESVSDSEGTFEFGGWYDENGLIPENIYAENNLTLHAKWNRLIDKIEISYAIPHAGEHALMPEVPDGAPYKLTHVSLLDEEWYEVTEASDSGEMNLNFEIKPVSEEIKFVTAINEYGEEEYTGILLFNGEETEAWYDPYENSVSGSFSFVPLPAQ